MCTCVTIHGQYYMDCCICYTCRDSQPIDSVTDEYDCVTDHATVCSVDDLCW